MEEVVTKGATVEAAENHNTTKVSLNEEQAQAVNHIHGPCLVLATPGAGKTRIVIERTCNLIQNGISPKNILSITFTNKSAGEMKERTVSRVGHAAKQIYVSTFHALCANLLRSYGKNIGYGPNMTICDSDDQVSLMAQASRQLGHELPKPLIKEICDKTNSLREELIPESSWDQEFAKDGKGQFTPIAREYVSRLRSSSTIDFSGLLSESLRLLEEDPVLLQKLQSRFTHIQVDEAQDCNKAQHAIVQAIGNHNNIMMVGDLDQCFPAGTMISTLDKNNNALEIPIENIRPGDKVLSCCGKSEYSLRNVTEVFCKKKLTKLVTIKTATNKTITCTPEHKIFASFITNYRTRKHEHTKIKFVVKMCGSYISKHSYYFQIYDKKLIQPIEEMGLETYCYDKGMSESSGESDSLGEIYNILDNIKKICDDIEIIEYGKFTYISSLELIPAFHAQSGMSVFIKNGTKIVEDKITEVSISPESTEIDVYDINVERTHNYIANNIVVHNCIYSWRGASPDCVNKFVEEKNARTIVLSKNYRSTPEIVSAADKLIRHNTNRQHSVKFSTVNPSGDPVESYVLQNQDIEGKWVAMKIKEMIDEGYKPEEIAVLYRLNSMSRSIEQGLFNEGINYEVIGGMNFFDRMEVKDAIAMLRFYVNNNDGSALSRFINSPSRGIGEVSLGKIENFARDNEITLVEALSRAGEIFTGHAKANMIHECKKIAQIFSMKKSEDEDIGDILHYLTTNLDYHKHLESDKYKDSCVDRKNNLDEIIKSSSEYAKRYGNDITSYLNHLMLSTSSDKKDKSGCVSLMTMHASKGLEYPVVFLPCVVQDIVPHKRAVTEREGGLEEERRLFFVAMTRAKKRLFISYHANTFIKTYSKSNHKNSGIYKSTMPSMFLAESDVLKKCKKA